jgi:hypothetical protein
MYLSKDRLAPEAGLYRAVDDSKECEELNPEEATSEKCSACYHLPLPQHILF